MSNMTAIIVLLGIILLGGVMFVWYVSDMFDLLRYKIDVLEKQHREMMRGQTRNYQWILLMAEGKKCDS